MRNQSTWTKLYWSNAQAIKNTRKHCLEVAVPWFIRVEMPVEFDDDSALSVGNANFHGIAAAARAGGPLSLLSFTSLGHCWPTKGGYLVLISGNWIIQKLFICIFRSVQGSHFTIIYSSYTMVLGKTHSPFHSLDWWVSKSQKNHKFQRQIIMH